MARTDADLAVPRHASRLAAAIAFVAVLWGLLALVVCLGAFLRDVVYLAGTLFGAALPEGRTLGQVGLVVPVELLAVAYALVFLRCAGGVYFEATRKWCIALAIVLLGSAGLMAAYHFIPYGIKPGGLLLLWVAAGYAVLGLFYFTPLCVCRPAGPQLRPGQS